MVLDKWLLQCPVELVGNDLEGVGSCGDVADWWR